MPKYKVLVGRNKLDVVLTRTRSSTGHYEVDGRWTWVTVIELSKQEVEDWERVQEEYYAWADRIEEMSIAARRAGPKRP